MTEKPKAKSSQKRGKLFVVSAPSGCGKTTLCNKLLSEDLGLANSISMTTRKPRPGEKNGVDYYFVSKERFLTMIREKGFLEYEDNFGSLYGTPKSFVDENLEKGKNVLLSIDVKGAMKVRRLYGKRSVLVFILPPSIDALKNRLHTRMSDAKSAISTRLNEARTELAYKDKYDYRIVNDSLEKAYERLKRIIAAEKTCK